jgi:hypothetical protein
MDMLRDQSGGSDRLGGNIPTGPTQQNGQGKF